MVPNIPGFSIGIGPTLTIPHRNPIRKEVPKRTQKPPKFGYITDLSHASLGITAPASQKNYFKGLGLQAHNTKGWKEMNSYRYHKGQADVVYLLVSGFATTLAIVMVLFAWSSLSGSAQYQNSLANSVTNPVGAKATASANTAIFTVGNFFAVVWLISGIASIIFTFFVDSAPVFAVWE